jgi:hypothetical protein
MGVPAGLLLEWVLAEILPALIVDVSARAIGRAATCAKLDARAAQETSPDSGLRPRLHLVEGTRVLSEAGGRARVEVVGMRGDPRLAAEVERKLTDLPGIAFASASWMTGNVLVEFDPGQVCLSTLRQVIDPLPAASAQPTRRERQRHGNGQLALGLS